LDECGEKLRILMVEDSEDDALLIQRQIQKDGIEASFERVSSEDAFINALDTRSWDMILCDYAMDGFTGLEALSIFQRYDLVIPFILISGTIGEEIAVEAMRRGASDYIMKDHLLRLVPAIKREMKELEVRREREEGRLELAKSEERFAAAFRTSTDGIAIARASDGVFIQVNDEFCRIFGYTREEVTGKNSLELGIWLSEEDRLAFTEPVRELGVVRNYEAKMGTSQGQVIFAQISAEYIDIEGEKCILSFTRDITEKVEKERALKERESRLRNITENANQIIFSVNDEGRVSFISPAWERITGYKAGDILGRSFLEFVHPEDLKKGKDALVKVTKEGIITVPAIIRMKKNKGDWCWFSIVGGVLETADPENLEYGGIAEDITERKLSEDKLQETYRRLSTILESVPDAIYLKDREGIFLEVNRAYEEFTGISRDCILGTRGESVLPPEVFETNLETDKKVRESGDSIHFEKVFDNFGEPVYFSIYKAPLLDENNELTGIIGVSNDVTEVKVAEKKIRSALEGAIHTISSIVEIRDPYTAGHQQRASRLAVAIGRQMGLERDRMEALRVSSLVYEIGKIAIPSEILNKPGSLNSMEKELIRIHPSTAGEILGNIDFPWPIAQIVSQHHERINGSGYPLGIKGDEILFEARILSVADVVEAMCSHRPYRPSLGIEAALQEVERNSGILYDPEVVNIACKLFREKNFSLA